MQLTHTTFLWLYNNSARTTLIWAIAVHYGYDAFSWTQLVGFLVLVIGVFLFNGVFSSIIVAIRQRFAPRQEGERAPLLA